MSNKKLLFVQLIIIICFSLIYVVVEYKYLGARVLQPFNYHGAWWKNLVHYAFQLAMGMIIKFEYIMQLLKYNGRKKINVSRCLIICLPAFIFSLAITPYLLPKSILLAGLYVFGTDGFLLFFRVLLGYNIISCIEVVPNKNIITNE